MNTNDLNTALYEKMAAEQDKYRDWLKSQPPEEILHHTYEYTVREDIVMAMEDLELTDAQAQALLDSPTPLADVYRHFEKLETGYMDVIRDSIENRADDVCKVLEEQRSIPLYLHSAAYASQHGEMAQYNRSYQANFDCKEAIEHAISAHYADNRLDTESAVKAVLEKFGSERVQFILANTIQHKDSDGRVSRDNKAWAKTIPMPEDSGTSRHCAYLVVDEVNLGLTDLFTRQARKTLQEPEKGSVLQKLKQEPTTHNSCMGIHWTLRFSMMRCGPLLTNAGQNDILQKLPKFLRKWRTARLCRNFGNRTAKNFPMRQIWSGTSSWGRCAVYTLSVKRNRAYEEARPLL